MTNKELFDTGATHVKFNDEIYTLVWVHKDIFIFNPSADDRIYYRKYDKSFENFKWTADRKTWNSLIIKEK